MFNQYLNYVENGNSNRRSNLKSHYNKDIGITKESGNLIDINEEKKVYNKAAENN
ncbi:14555_t:CDS:2 [Dentiscutata erythropus]|uniref:14555_t:CDS:1 n=1 Tax=Dentiscutata erythropus TaxID=1348616 RepID=A0A9N9DJN7_9GLOM|nr:14555_t:CDS:2 [Dentiscutata erythropus]